MTIIVGKQKSVRKIAEDENVEYDITPKGGIVMNYDNDDARRMVERCYRTSMTMINPIYDWTDNDVWEFLDHYGCKSNPLYQCGFSRIGCIGCPMQRPNKVKAEFERYPKYKQAYIHAFDRMVSVRNDVGLKSIGAWENGESVFEWWIGGDPLQLKMDFDGGNDDD